MSDETRDRKQRVVVLGAVPQPDRYANRAVRLLLEHGHDVVPVHPRHAAVEGLPVIARLEQVDGVVDTLTLYVSAEKSTALAAAICGLAPGRVIFNPGTENPELQAALEQAGVAVVIGCTLVMLRTGRF